MRLSSVYSTYRASLTDLRTRFGRIVFRLDKCQVSRHSIIRVHSRKCLIIVELILAISKKILAPPLVLKLQKYICNSGRLPTTGNTHASLLIVIEYIGFPEIP
uniref:Uncharacterized protein n=1 Tax=Sipha flava TaxID=143950 RepID=A0A2S2RBB3_9HEMI